MVVEVREAGVVARAEPEAHRGVGRRIQVDAVSPLGLERAIRLDGDRWVVPLPPSVYSLMENWLVTSRIQLVGLFE